MKIKSKDIYKELYRVNKFSITPVKYNPSNYVIAGLLYGKDTRDNINFFLKMGFNVLILGNDSSVIESVNKKYINSFTFINESKYTKQFVPKKSLNKYRAPYTYNRIGKLCMLRNALMNEIYHKYCNNLMMTKNIILFDFDLMIDKDAINNIIYNSNKSMYLNNVLTASGLFVKNNQPSEDVSHHQIKNDSFGSIIYYDTSAFREYGSMRNDLNRDFYIHDHLNAGLHSILGGVIHDLRKSFSKNESYQVDSAFGGMMLLPARVLSDVFRFINYTDGVHKPYLLYKNGMSDSNIEYECEHVSFNKLIRSLGYKIFIDYESIIFYNE